MRKTDSSYLRWVAIRYLPWFAFIVAALIGVGIWGLERVQKTYQSTARVYVPLQGFAESRSAEWIETVFFDLDRKVRLSMSNQLPDGTDVQLSRDTPSSVLIEAIASSPQDAFMAARVSTTAVVAQARSLMRAIAATEVTIQQDAFAAARDRLAFQAEQLSQTQMQFARLASGPLDRYIGQRRQLLAQLNDQEEPMDVLAPVISNIEALSDSIIDNPQAHAAIKAQQAFFDVAAAELAETADRMKLATVMSARLAADAEAPVRVIAQAQLPQAERGIQNKPILMGLAVLAIAFLLVRLHAARDHTIRRTKDVETKLGLPVFGTVPELVTSVQS